MACYVSQEEVEKSGSAEPRAAKFVKSKAIDFLENTWSGCSPNNRSSELEMKWEIASAIMRQNQASCILV